MLSTHMSAWKQKAVLWQGERHEPDFFSCFFLVVMKLFSHVIEVGGQQVEMSCKGWDRQWEMGSKGSRQSWEKREETKIARLFLFSRNLYWKWTFFADFAFTSTLLSLLEKHALSSSRSFTYFFLTSYSFSYSLSQNIYKILVWKNWTTSTHSMRFFRDNEYLNSSCNGLSRQKF